MKLRKTKKYKTTPAKTAKIKKSSMPYMEMLKNQKHEDNLQTFFCQSSGCYSVTK